MTSLIYSRVSTTTQKTDRQIGELLDLAKRDGSKIDRIIKEKISGTKPLFKRKKGSEIKELVESGEIGMIYVHEISRLGRNVADVANTIEFLIKHKCNLRVLDAGLSLFRDGEVDIAARMVINVLVSLAQNERDLLSQRTKSGIRHAKSNGSVFGKRKHEKTDEIIRHFNNGKTASWIISETGVSRSIVYRIKKSI